MRGNSVRSFAQLGVVVSIAALIFSALPAFAGYEPGPTWGGNGTGDGEFSSAEDVAAADGLVYVADRLNDRVQQFTTAGSFVRAWGTSGTLNGQLDDPSGVAVGPDGSVFVTDGGNARIQKFNPDGTFVTTWGSSGTGDGQFAHPSGVTVDTAGNIYVTDSGADTLQKFSPAMNLLWKRGSEGSGNEQFYVPMDVAVGSDGNIYVADWMNHRIQILSPSGDFIGRWGSVGADDGQLSTPTGIATDSEGHIFVVDGTERVQKLTLDGTFVTKWELAKPQDAWTQGRGVDVDENGDVYVVEMMDKVQKFLAIRPTTTVTGPSRTSDRTPTFTLASDSSGATFECRLKYPGTSFEPCNENFTPAQLPEGTHVLVAKAVAPDGLEDLTPASKKFVIDTTAPKTTFVAKPAARTEDRTPTFKFSSTEPGTFECKLDDKAFNQCSSPYTTPRLSFGEHTFKVRAIDRAGNVDKTPAIWEFEVER